MPNMKDVAALARVSPATVSRVLSGHPSVKPETRAAVLRCIKQLNYQPNASARSLAGGRTGLIGVILPDIANPFFAEILHEIEEQADFEGYSILISCSQNNLAREKAILNRLSNLHVDGIIATPVVPEKSRNEFLKLNVPVISITKTMDGFSSVSISHYNAGRRIARYLLGLGFERLGYVGSISSDSMSAQKFAGFHDYLLQSGYELADLINLQDTVHAQNVSTAKMISRQIQERGLRSDAIFACDDVIACETIHALLSNGLRVPQDIAVAGFDNSLLSRKMIPSITSLAQPLREIGKQAVELLISYISRGEYEIEDIELRTRIISRESTSVIH